MRRLITLVLLAAISVAATGCIVEPAAAAAVGAGGIHTAAVEVNEATSP